MTDSWRGLLRNREFVALAGTAFARSQAYSTVLIALALYADAFGTTGVVEGLFGTGFALVQLLVVLPLGRAVDTGNAKRYIVAGLVVNVLVFVGFMFVSNAVHVILVRVVQGVGASVLWITGSAVVGEISPDDARGRWLGTYNQVGAFSSFAGDIAGGYLLYAYGFQFTYVVLSAITLLALALVAVYLRDDPGGTDADADGPAETGLETIRSLLGRSTVRSLVAFRVLFSVGKLSVIVFLPIYARKTFGVSALAIGGILAGGKLTKSLLQGWMGDLTDRVGGEHRFVIAGALIYALGTALIPVASVAQAALPAVGVSTPWGAASVTPAVVTLFVAYGVLGVADSVRLPASMALFVTEGEAFDSVASSLSLRSVSWKVGQVAGPVLIGGIKAEVSTTAAFLTAAGFAVAATATFVYLNGQTSLDRVTYATPGD